MTGRGSRGVTISEPITPQSVADAIAESFPRRSRPNIHSVELIQRSRGSGRPTHIARALVGPSNDQHEIAGAGPDMKTAVERLVASVHLWDSERPY